MMNENELIDIKEENTLNTELDEAASIESQNCDNSKKGARCGEIFVANNAKKWTFICTFCEKGTTEIDEFIIHIKQAHIPGTNFDDGDHCSDLLPYPVRIKQELNWGSSSNAANKKNYQEYLDYNCYLDVKVHTDSDTMCYNNNDNSANDDRIEENFWKKTRYENCNNGTERFVKSEPHSSDSECGEVFGNYHHNVEEDSDQLQDNETDSGDEEVEEIRPDDDYYSPTHSKNILTTSLPNLPESLTLPSVTRKKRQRKRKFASRRAQIRGPAYCEICSRTFQYYSLYRNHMIKHSNETPFKCQECNKGFKSKQALRYHMSTHQRVKDFKCTICDQSFYQESMFITHLQTHQNDSTYPCMQCGKLHRSSSERDIHMRVHTNDRPFQCDHCFKRFRLRHHLSNHLKLHRQYKCDYCKRKFASTVALRKPYSCQSCCDKSHPNRQFESEASSLNKLSHFFNSATSTSYPEQTAMKTVPTMSTAPLTTEAVAAVLSQKSSAFPQMSKPYVCKDCNKTYAQLGGLNFHMKTKHSKS